MIHAYYSKLTSVLEKIHETQMDKMEDAANLVASVIEQDGLVYIFGCGHSHLSGLDCFYRAGGLANVSAMLDTDLMLHNGAAKSSVMEKMSGIAPSILDRYCLTEKDLLIIVSTSGKNAVPVEMAQAARSKGLKTVSIVSSAYFADKKDAPMVYQCTDLYIDNCVPHGDAVIEIPGISAKMGSVSTAANALILQSVLLRGAELAANNGAAVPVYMSGNVEGGSEFNKKLIQRYLPRVKHL